MLMTSFLPFYKVTGQETNISGASRKITYVLVNSIQQVKSGCPICHVLGYMPG